MPRVVNVGGLPDHSGCMECPKGAGSGWADRVDLTAGYGCISAVRSSVRTAVGWLYANWDDVLGLSDLASAYLFGNRN